MYLYNFHSHSCFDDGKCNPEEYLTEAIRLGFKSYGFSGHAPLPFESVWCIQKENFQKYLKEIGLLKEKYVGIIDVYSGLEIDYIKGITGPAKFRECNLDYVIGSVHFVEKGGEVFEIDGPYENFEKGFKEVFDCDKKALVYNFYEKTCDFLKSDKPDLLGHFDKVKLHLMRTVSGLESEEWYKNLLKDVLVEIKNSGVIVEINVRGIYKGYTKEPYPAYDLIKQMKKLGIKISLNSDSHHISEITSKYNEVIPVLKGIGYEESMVFEEGVWKPIKL